MADTTQESSARFYWAFMNDPAKWEIDKFLRSGKAEAERGVNRQATNEIRQFRPGQLAVIRVGHDHRNKNRLGGNPRLKRGIYAVCEILSEVFYKDVGSADEFSDGAEVHPQGWPTVRVRYIRSYLENPLLIDDLKIKAAELNARLLRGTQSPSIRISEEDFNKVLSLLDAQTEDWSGSPETPADLKMSDTEYDALVKARRGQAEFKDKLLGRWGNACAVSGCTVRPILRASHITPWGRGQSTPGERLDPANGLLLTAHLDALFDKYLISFTDDGKMLVANSINPSDRRLLGIPKDLCGPLKDNEKVFLAKHRDIFGCLNRNASVSLKAGDSVFNFDAKRGKL